VSDLSLPTQNALVDVIIHGTSYRSRVEDVTGAVYSVTAPMDVPIQSEPVVGRAVELAWLRGENRFAVAVIVADVRREQGQLVVEVAGFPYKHNRREYFRGGGGEPIRLTNTLTSLLPVSGYVIDISEGGVRCRMRDGAYKVGDVLDATVWLGDDMMQTRARVLYVRFDKETALYDVVATYPTNEKIARVIRRYVLHQQILERRRLLSLNG
jgi:c-di-GMP-binding flagellar brake protein YcgR